MIPSSSVLLFSTLALPLVAGAAAASAIALPLLIHLLSRQRYQIVPWAAMRFLISAQKSSRRSIDRWLLLLTRILALLMVLAGLTAVAPWAEDLWQRLVPGVMEATSNAPRTHRILVVDATLSMNTRVGDKSRFELMQQQLERAIQAANPGDGFTLIYLAGNAQAVIPGPASDRDKVLQEARQLRATHANGDLASSLSLVADTLQRSPKTFPRKQVLLFSDLQRSAWSGLLPKPDGTAPDLWQRILPKAEVHVVDCSGGEPDNLAITDLTLSDTLPLVEAPTAVTATVQNFGQLDRKGVRVELHLGRPSAGGPETTLLPIDQRLLESLPAGQRQSVTFSLEGAKRFRESGLHLLQVKLSDADDLTPDDSRTLAFEVREAIPTVLVNGQPAADPLRQATGYLQEAFELGGRRLPGNPVRSKTLKLSEFADPTLGDLTGVDCVFLCDVPTVSPAQLSRLEAHLKRGGGLVIGLGPNAAANLDFYNRVLFNAGRGLLPGKLLGLKSSLGDELGFRLQADDDAYRKPPLDAFRDDNARAGLTSVPFKKYISLDAPAEVRARRVLSFVPGGPVQALANPGQDPAAAQETKADPAVIEWVRHRGRVVVFTSSFNTDWGDWPLLPSFLPFAYEVLQFAASNPDRHTARVGEVLEEFYPLTSVGLSVTIAGPEGLSTTTSIQAGDDLGIVRTDETPYAGVYRLTVSGQPTRLFAVNIPETGSASESDLRKLDPAELKPLGAINVVTDSLQAETASTGDSLVTLSPRPHGPKLSRWLLTIALGLVLFEAWLAWRLGPSRGSAGLSTASANQADPPSRLRFLFNLMALLPFMAVFSFLAVIVHDEWTGQVLGFLPHGWRSQLEQLLGVPAAGVGEGSRWRLEGFPAYLRDLVSERRLLVVLCAVLSVGLVALYRLERRAAGAFHRLIMPLLLRGAAVALLLFVLLPQLRLTFDREGWPDLVILLDTSASMATVDDFQDPAVKAKAAELARLANLTQVDRLRLAKLLIQRPGSGSDLLTRLLQERQVKIHVYTMDEQTKLLQEILESSDIATAQEAINRLKPEGEGSRLGEAVLAVLKAFRGGSLVAIVAYTDGVITSGEDWPRASREAARANVPLFLVGLGDAREPPDFILSDLKAPDSVLKNDTLVFEAKVTAKGPVPSTGLPVILSERVGEKSIELARVSVAPDPRGKPLSVRLTTVPKEPGERTYILEVPEQPNEAEAGNNRLERVILVTENKRLKVLYLEGYPRYEFRFVKAFLERETEAVAGNKSIDLSVYLSEASSGYAEQDKSALRALPTKTELFNFDVVIYGDLLPTQIPKANQFYQDLADFVKVRGGGLLFIAGTQATPHQLFGTPIGELLPLVPSDSAPPEGPKPGPDTQPLTEEYRPKPTPFGQLSSLLRFSSDEAESLRIWNDLKPMFWAAGSYKRKQAAEVLAVHPDRPAEGAVGELHPIILQQFIGSGRVLFYAFDETWRWRFRSGEERFNQFWMQTAQVLSRNRVSRPELKTDKQTNYRRDEPIKLTVRFPDDAPPPGDEAKIRVSVERLPLQGVGAVDSQTVQLAKVEGTRATYQTLITRTPEGQYKFQLVEPAQGLTKPRAEVKVVPPPGERERLEMNSAELQRAAADSRGKFYTLAEADKLPDDLPAGERIPLNQPCPPISLWNHGAMYALVLMLFGLEWIIRRRERLL